MGTQNKGLALADIMSAKKTIKIDLAEFGFEGVEPLSITFKANFWSAEAQDRYKVEGEKLSAANEGRALEAHEDVDIILTAALLDWNLRQDGQPMPITAETLDKLNYTLVRGILDKMIEAIRPNPLMTSRN